MEEMINKLTKGPESECGEERYLLNGFCLFLVEKLCGDFYYQSPDKKKCLQKKCSESQIL